MSLKQVLASKCVTQTQLAEAIGTTRARVTRWANGKTMPTRSMQLVIAYVLGMELEDLENQTGWIK